MKHLISGHQDVHLIKHALIEAVKNPEKLQLLNGRIIIHLANGASVTFCPEMKSDKQINSAQTHKLHKKDDPVAIKKLLKQVKKGKGRFKISSAENEKKTQVFLNAAIRDKYLESKKTSQKNPDKQRDIHVLTESNARDIADFAGELLLQHAAQSHQKNEDKRESTSTGAIIGSLERTIANQSALRTKKSRSSTDSQPITSTTKEKVHKEFTLLETLNALANQIKQIKEALEKYLTAKRDHITLVEGEKQQRRLEVGKKDL